MSKEPEESVISQEIDTADKSVDVQNTTEVSEAVPELAPTSEVVTETTECIENAESILPENSSAEVDETETAGDNQTPENTDVPADAEVPSVEKTNDKILAIKSALREERQQEETKLQIADKVRKFKTAKETGEPIAPVVENTTTESPETAQKQPKKKKKSKKKKQKKQKFSLLPQKGDSVLEVFRKFVFLASSAIFVACLCLIADYFWENHQNNQLMTELSDIYTSDEEEPEKPTEPPIEGFEYYSYLPNVQNLLDINPDVVGWLSIPGTNVSYPILQRREPNGNDFYLERNIKMEKAKAGSIFLDFRNNLDYVIDGKKQVENSGNLIVYGHNMHDYSMFGSLKHYVNNIYYYGEHPVVELNSNYKKYKYKIFGFIIVDIEDETETKFDYWNQLDFADEQAFYDYVNEIKRRTIRLNDVDVKYGDELLTLSTCNSTFSDGRLVVFARKLRDGEDPLEGTQTSIKNPNIKWPNSYYKWHKNTYDPEAEFVPYG